MCSFYKLDTATRLLPGDIIMIPPESGRNRRMRLAPDSLRRKYGFRFGESIAPYLGSMESSLRTIFLADADKPKWALVESLNVTSLDDDDSELLAANMLDAPEPYPVVDYVNITAFSGGTSIVALANTALSSLPNPVERYDYAHRLPKSPVVRAIEAGLGEHAAAPVEDAAARPVRLDTADRLAGVRIAVRRRIGNLHLGEANGQDEKPGEKARRGRQAGQRGHEVPSLFLNPLHRHPPFSRARPRPRPSRET